jgi:hypothetical protein
MTGDYIRSGQRSAVSAQPKKQNLTTDNTDDTDLKNPKITIDLH